MHFLTLIQVGITPWLELIPAGNALDRSSIMIKIQNVAYLDI